MVEFRREDILSCPLRRGDEAERSGLLREEL